MSRILDNDNLDIEKKIHLIRETTKRLDREHKQKEQLIRTKTGTDLLDLTDDLNCKMIDAIKAKVALLNEV